MSYSIFHRAHACTLTVYDDLHFFVMIHLDTAFGHGYSYFTRDLMATNTDSLNIQAYEYTGYASQITDMKSYFEENMKLLDEDNREALFKSGNSIYTKIRDDNPTRYINGSKAKNVMVADGCVIEGTVENRYVPHLYQRYSTSRSRTASCYRIR